MKLFRVVLRLLLSFILIITVFPFFVLGIIMAIFASGFLKGWDTYANFYTDFIKKGGQ